MGAVGGAVVGVSRDLLQNGVNSLLSPPPFSTLQSTVAFQ